VPLSRARATADFDLGALAAGVLGVSRAADAPQAPAAASGLGFVADLGALPGAACTLGAQDHLGAGRRPPHVCRPALD
jgi:hypothetical protein